ncbi:MAG: 50S ribosomal protein L30 [Desulfuromonadaceae bacterium]|nr:50S ribosomal protein L30 [Desulfuromonadaceae bacterium]
MSGILKITLTKSTICAPKKHTAVVAGLGLSKLNQTVQRQDTPQIRGMINKVGHLLTVE